MHLLVLCSALIVFPNAFNYNHHVTAQTSKNWYKSGIKIPLQTPTTLAFSTLSPKSNILPCHINNILSYIQIPYMYPLTLYSLIFSSILQSSFITSYTLPTQTQLSSPETTPPYSSPSPSPYKAVHPPCGSSSRCRPPVCRFRQKW